MITSATTRYNLIKRIFLFVLVPVLFSTAAYSQQFYVNDSSQLLYLVTITPGGTTSQTVGGCGTGSYFSIAIKGTKLYYSSLFGGLYVSDISTQNGTPVITNCTPVANVIGNSLTISNNDIIYYAGGNTLMSIDPKNPVPVTLGTMPYSSAGDLIFYNNELYMASGQGIVKVNISSPSQSTLYIPMPNESILALTTVSVKNQPNKVYALSSLNSNTKVIELDMDHQTIVGVVGTLPYLAYDAGSEVEAGEVASIVVDSTVVKRECNALNKGYAQIYCKTSASIYTYTLNNGINNQSGLFNNLAPGNYEAIITSNGTESPKKVPFTVDDFSLSNPPITATQINPICDIKGQLKLDAGTLNSLYQVKYGNDVFGFDHTYTNLTPGSYHFSILNQKGCLIDEKDYILTQEVCPPIIIDSVVIKPECNAYGMAAVQVYTSPHPDNYTYTLNGVTNSTGLFNLIKPGTYTLDVVSSGGDHQTRQVIVPDFTLDKPGIAYTLKNAVCTLTGTIKFMVTGDAKGAMFIRYRGRLYNFNETITGVYAGTNHFSILNINNCIIDERDIDVVQDKCQPVSFPNTFTPNGDGVNDTFGPNQDSNPLGYKLTIYSRYGSPMFTTSSLYQTWSGDDQGKAIPPGVYYWIATYTTDDGKRNVQKGYVALIR